MYVLGGVAVSVLGDPEHAVSAVVLDLLDVVPLDENVVGTFVFLHFLV